LLLFREQPGIGTWKVLGVRDASDWPTSREGEFAAIRLDDPQLGVATMILDAADAARLAASALVERTRAALGLRELDDAALAKATDDVITRATAADTAPAVEA
jgi:hypothetical protein